jgi:hypothetical protein
MQRLLTVSGAIALVWLAPSSVGAQSRATFVPSLSLSSVYDDNIFVRRIGAGDQMTMLSPGIEVGYETSRNTVTGVYSFDMQRSLGHPALNDLEARRHGLFDGRFRRTPQLTLALVSRYDRTETAGELSFNTGLLLERRQAVRWEINPSFVYQVNPRTTVTALYDRTAENIVGETAAFEHIGRLGVTRQVSSRATAGLGYAVRHFINGDETHTSNAILFSTTYAFSPSLMFMSQAGPRLSSRGTLAPELVLALARRAVDSVGISLDVWRGESIILGVLGPVEVLSTTAKLTWPIRRQVEMGLHGGLFESSTLSQGKARVYHTEAVAAWSPMGSIILAVSYGADFQHGDVRSSLLSDQTVVRHLFQVRLTAAPHLTRSFQPEDPLRPLGDSSKGVQR